MRLAPRPFFALCVLIFIAAVGFCAWHLLPAENDGVMSCSTKGIMRFENMDKENVNGTIHFTFGSQGKGSMVVEGYTDSAAGWLYLQRYVKFTYNSKRISATERHYLINKWESSASSIDESPNVIFDYFMREMSDSHDGLFLNAQKLNEKAILLSSINSPLWICTLKSGSKLD
ncbi:FidL-like protein [Kluyvera intermedia]|uniref:FidL-like protein n=1 Tax=Kluyvera intermedia TaxID=61648 RepID=UPI0039F62D45